MTPTPEQVADALDETADLIEKRGWLQDVNTDGVRFCLMGGINYVAYGGDMYMTVSAGGEALHRATDLRVYMCRALYEALDTIEGNPDSVLLVKWNDRDGRSMQEVLDLLRRGAKGVRGGVV